MTEQKDTQQWMAIVNPVSGNGKAAKQWDKVQVALQQAKVNYQHKFTTKFREAETLVQQAIKDGYRHIISVGGDGNIHDIANGILSQSEVPSHEVTIAVVPLGTGNDFIKHYGIPKDIGGAVQLIDKGNTTLHDAGKAISYEDGKPATRYFINFCGMGFDAFVVERAANLKPFGQIAYLLGTLRWMFPYRKPKLRITTPDKTLETYSYMALAGISRYSAGGMLLTPGAVSNDGLFYLSIAKNVSKIEFVLRIKMLYDGSFPQHREVEVWETPSIKIEVLEEHFPVKMQADGDLLGTGPFEVNILPRALRFVVP